MNKVQQEKLQHAKSATGEECKTKTWQLVKVQHEIEQYIKKECNRKKSVAWKDYYTKKCNMEMVQYDKSENWKEFNMKKDKLPQWNKEKVYKNSAL